MIRLLKVVPTLMCGGTENQFMTLGRRLDASRFSLEFACLRRWGQFVDEIAARGIPLTEYPIPTFRSFKAIAQQSRLARHILHNSIDIVHTYNFYGNVFAIPPARLVRTAVTIASIRDRGPYLTAAQKRVQRYVCRLAHCVLVNAEAVKDWLVADGYDASKIVVIRNGVDLDRFETAADPAKVRHELGIAANAPLVVVVSRLIRMKGIEYVLDAAAMLAPRFPEARLLVVGEPSPPTDRAYYESLVDRAARLGLASRVIFTGLRSDVPSLLAAATVSVMPSLNEALSNVLLESMAAGAPVVATRVGGTAEAVEDGTTGFLVAPADPAALAAAIGRLLEDPALAQRIGRAGRQRIIDRFSMDRMVSATQNLYERLLEQRRPAPATAAEGRPHRAAPTSF